MIRFFQLQKSAKKSPYFLAADFFAAGRSFYGISGGTILAAAVRACLAAAAFAAAATAGSAADRESAAARTLVLANASVDSSRSLAGYYMEKRGIPEENLFLIETDDAETIAWDRFITTIYNPLRRRLLEEEWLLGEIRDERDREGRQVHITAGHRIEYLVVCRGVPLRISHDGNRLPADARERLPEQLRTNRAAVDSHLALLSHTFSPINALVGNPLFERTDPDVRERAAVIRVSRLDGPGYAEAENLVDSALEGEAGGLRGRAYIDLGGPHPRGDEWLERTAARIEEMGFDLTVAGTEETFDSDARFDAPALYFGWYAPHIEGPFLKEGFRFPPGAIAFHIHSFSASTLRASDRRWTGPFVARGAAGAVGNVYEPYLEFTHRPDLFFDALSRGRTLGEAAYYSLPALGWQAVLIGDPLYRPFAEADDAVGDSLDQYAVIRRMNLLIREDKRDEAILLGMRRQEELPQLPLALFLARMHQESGNTDRVLELFDFFPGSDPVEDIRSGVVAECFDFLLEHDGVDRALEMARVLIEESELPAFARQTVLEMGIETARRAGEPRLAQSWSAELRKL